MILNAGNVDDLESLKKSILSLSGVAVLSSEEQKKVKGGCGLNYYKDGVKVKATREMTMQEAKSQQLEWQHDADGRALYDMVYWCCASC